MKTPLFKQRLKYNILQKRQHSSHQDWGWGWGVCHKCQRITDATKEQKLPRNQVREGLKCSVTSVTRTSLVRQKEWQGTGWRQTRKDGKDGQTVT